jgi:hypothetical protein
MPGPRPGCLPSDPAFGQGAHCPVACDAELPETRSGGSLAWQLSTPVIELSRICFNADPVVCVILTFPRI